LACACSRGNEFFVWLECWLVVGFGGGFVGWGSPTGSVLLVRSGGCSVVLY